MRLNPDCIRDILLVVEDRSLPQSYFCFPKEWPTKSLDLYSYDELYYHIDQCFMSGLLIESSVRRVAGNIYIKDLSPLGHDFLANIREEKNWKKTKSVASKAGSLSLKILESIAASVATAFVNKQLGL